MNEYEITYLIDPQLDEEAREELNRSVDGKVTELSGTVSSSSPVLRRKLAYPVAKTHSAFLRTIHIQLDPEHIGMIQDMLKRHKSVLRFSILNTPQREDMEEKIMANLQEARASIKKPGARKPVAKKEVTMAEVEKGIEEALSEEVK